MIKNLIFDFGKVLVDYDFEAFFRKYIPDTERCQAFTPVLYNEELQQLLDREERPFEVIMEEWIKKNKELMIIPGASHCDLYDGGKDKVIPWDKLEVFFNENM